MENRFGENKRNGRNSYTNEPHYENPDESDFLDDLFSESSSGQRPQRQNEKFKVTLPGEENFRGSDSSSQSRVPKGKPVSSSRPPQSQSYNPQSRASYDSAAQNRVSRIPNGAPVRKGEENASQSYRRTMQKRQTPIVSKNEPKSSAPSSANRQGARPSRPQKPFEPVSTSSKKQKNIKSKKGSKAKKIAVGIFCVFLALILAVGAYGWSILGKINYDTTIRSENKYIKSSLLASDKKVRNILFIGSDERKDPSEGVSGMRSDTMMLFSIDKKNKKIKLTSFLRDSYVCIPSTGNYRKLNAACSAGGAQLVIDTIEYNFKVDIDNYILIDFEAFKKFIDMIGGLDVDGVTEAEAKYMRDVVKAPNVKKGKNHFTGGAALWYCRIRYLDNDFYRTQRQRKVISALMTQIKKTNPTTLMKAVETVMPMISTDIPRNDFLSLGVGAVTQYLRYDIMQHQVPAKGTWSDPFVRGEGQVLKMDIDQNTKLLYDFIYVQSETEEETTKKASK